MPRHDHAVDAQSDTFGQRQVKDGQAQTITPLTVKDRVEEQIVGVLGIRNRGEALFAEQVVVQDRDCLLVERDPLLHQAASDFRRHGVQLFEVAPARHDVAPVLGGDQGGGAEVDLIVGQAQHLVERGGPQPVPAGVGQYLGLSLNGGTQESQDCQNDDNGVLHDPQAGVIFRSHPQVRNHTSPTMWSVTSCTILTTPVRYSKQI